MNLTDIKHGRRYSFTTYGPVAGQSQFDGTAVAVISGRYIEPYTGALANHANIYPTLPADVTRDIDNNATSYDYLQLAHGTNMTFIGLPWIRETTLKEVIPRVATVPLLEFEDPDGSRLRAILESAGYTVGSISIT